MSRATDQFKLLRNDEGGPKALRQALHEYATHITKSLK